MQQALVPVTFAYQGSAEFRAWLKKVPGVKWDAKAKVWRVPFDVLPQARVEAGNIRLNYPWKSDDRPDSVLNSKLYQPQKDHAVTAYNIERAVLAFDTGTGKTPTTCKVLEAWQVESVLIITPAIVRLHWQNELDEWWPDHSDTGVINVGRTRKGLSKAAVLRRSAAYAAPIQIVSYALLDQVSLSGWDAVVLDEAHRLANPGSQQSKRVAEILSACGGDCRVLALTGTLVPNQPKDAWNVMNLLWPGLYGQTREGYDFPYQFLQRYTNQRDNGYGSVWEGLRAEHADEFSSRLRASTLRLTKSDVAEYLPPFTVSLLPIDSVASACLPESFDSWKAVQSGLDSGTAEKLPFVKEWVSDSFATGATHLAIMTHLRETVAEVGTQLLTTGVELFLITGEMSPEERNAALAKAKTTPKAIVVATMHSVGIGIDLTFATSALFVELYYRPETVIQALGRFSRLSGVAPSSVQILVRRGTIDERVANSLLAKVKDANRLLKPGDNDVKLAEALKDPRTETELLASMNESLLSQEVW